MRTILKDSIYTIKNSILSKGILDHLQPEAQIIDTLPSLQKESLISSLQVPTDVGKGGLL